MKMIHPMRHPALPAIAALLLTSIVSCRSDKASTEVSPGATGGDIAFNDAPTDKLFTDYLKLRTSLVKSDAAAAKAAAAEITGGAPEVLQAAAEVSSSDDLKTQRAAFQRLSAALVPRFQQALAKGSIHIQHCPMAMGGKGADWISESTAIRNPYYGDAMLECGEVTKTLTAGSTP